MFSAFGAKQDLEVEIKKEIRASSLNSVTYVGDRKVNQVLVAKIDYCSVKE